MKVAVGLIVAGPGVIREGYQALLSAITGVDSLEPASDGPSATLIIDTEQPDFVILDTSLGIEETTKTLRYIRKRHRKISCLVICPDPAVVANMRKLGADMTLVEGTTPAKFSGVVRSFAQEIRNASKGT